MHGLMLIVVALLWASASRAEIGPWTVQAGDGPATEQAGPKLELKLDAPGRCLATSALVSVTPGGRMAFSFDYVSEGLVRFISPYGGVFRPDRVSELTVTVTWRDAAGRDLDERLAVQGFPPRKRTWVFSENRGKPFAVADTLDVPAASLAGLPAAVQIVFELSARGDVQPARVLVNDVVLKPGEVAAKGFAVPHSGPADAGPLSSPPAGFDLPANLVTNPSFEEGNEGPTGWRLLGDNSGGAAVWKRGGAYAGKRCLQIFDRGPFVKSWDNTTGIYVPGGAPAAGTGAREEVQARFASDPAPAEPGVYYQASALLWFEKQDGHTASRINPVRVQFLDAAGEVLPYRWVYDDLMPTEFPYKLPGWHPVRTFAVPAPANAKSVRVVVAVHHADYYVNADGLNKLPENRGFVLVDNVELHRVPGGESLPSHRTQWGRFKTAEQDAFRAAVASNTVPFVPSSPAHRPNSVTVESWTGLGFGIITNAPRAGVARDVSLRLENALADVRKLQVRYDLLDWREQVVFSRTLPVTLKPYEETQWPIDRPGALPYGPYTVRYTITEAGKECAAGETRFGVVRANTVGYAEKGRMDYPFGIWSCFEVGMIHEQEMGETLKLAGVGKQWEGALSLAGDYANPAACREAMQQRIAAVRKLWALYRRYDLHPIGYIVPGSAVVPPAQYPVLQELIRLIVTECRDEIKIWCYGNEHITGECELDDEKRPNGMKALSWDRLGTHRQWWMEYLAAYDAAKQAVPDCLFGPFTCCDMGGKVLRDFFIVSPDKKLDLFSMNMYQNAFAMWPASMDELKKVGLEHLPIGAHEMAVASAFADSTAPDHYQQEAAAAAGTVTYWTEMLQAYPSFFYSPHNSLEMLDRLDDFTFMKRVRAQYVAYANMTECLGAGRFTAKYDLPGSLVFVRERSVRPGLVGVAWSTATESTVDLEVGVPQVVISDVWGNRREVKSANGVIALALTPMPQYVLGATTLKPAPTVKLAIANTTLNPRAPEVSVTVVNDRPTPLSGTLSLAAKSGLTVATKPLPVKALPAGATRTFTFRVQPTEPDSDRSLEVRASLQTDRRKYEALAKVNFAYALRVNAPPTIDGNLTEWTMDCPFVVNRAEQFKSFGSVKPWGGPAEMSGRLWMRWDDTNLYLAAKVREPFFTPAKEVESLWCSNAIEMLFDLTGSLQSDGPFTQIALGRIPDGTAHVYRYGQRAGEPATTRIAITHDGQDTTYEAVIPWDELTVGFRPTVGATISTVFNFNDTENGLRAIAWHHTVSPHDPSTFGRVRLVEPSAADN